MLYYYIAKQLNFHWVLIMNNRPSMGGSGSSSGITIISYWNYSKL